MMNDFAWNSVFFMYCMALKLIHCHFHHHWWVYSSWPLSWRVMNQSNIAFSFNTKYAVTLSKVCDNLYGAISRHISCTESHQNESWLHTTRRCHYIELYKAIPVLPPCLSRCIMQPHLQETTQVRCQDLLRTHSLIGDMSSDKRKVCIEQKPKSMYEHEMCFCVKIWYTTR